MLSIGFKEMMPALPSHVGLASGRSVTSCQDSVNVARMVGYVGSPATEAPLTIHGSNPLSQELALGLLLLSVLAFDFQHDYCAVRQPH